MIAVFRPLARLFEIWLVQEEEAMRIIIEFEKNRAWNKVPILRLIFIKI